MKIEPDAKMSIRLAGVPAIVVGIVGRSYCSCIGRLDIGLFGLVLLAEKPKR